MKKATISFLSLICFCSVLSGCINSSEDASKDNAGCFDFVCGMVAGIANEKDLSLCGIIQLHDRTLRNLNVNGTAELRNVTLSNLNVNGPVQLFSAKVANEINMNGPLHAKASTLNVINISTTTLKLDNCTVNSITVKPSKTMQEQVVTLKNTIAAGSIIFEQGNGKVMLEGNSTVKGKIIGGTAVHT